MNTIINKDGNRPQVNPITVQDPQRYITDSICPICHEHFAKSVYLTEQLQGDPRAEFLANLVNHYLYEHIHWLKYYRH